VQLFTGPHPEYHCPTDTPDRIDSVGLLKVAAVAREALVYLADRPEPLNFQGGKAAGQAHVSDKDRRGGRRVSTGCMPDFVFPGPGVKIGDVVENSAAAQAGLQKGDVIIELSGAKIDNLQTYSSRLKAFNPGDEVSLVALRGEQKISVKLKPGER
ncbi:MAG: PDZ domain-containing protein, partial [Candidatus Riflebacteria bacterium]|nr:PDZ domain-containing protein [Candidatus Riflebacteria bacterium]